MGGRFTNGQKGGDLEWHIKKWVDQNSGEQTEKQRGQTDERAGASGLDYHIICASKMGSLGHKATDSTAKYLIWHSLAPTTWHSLAPTACMYVSTSSAPIHTLQTFAAASCFTCIFHTPPRNLDLLPCFCSPSRFDLGPTQTLI